MNMNAASWSCERKNATLGNIYSQQHLVMLTNYYRSFLSFHSLAGVTSFGLKTGMMFDTQVIYFCTRKYSETYYPRSEKSMSLQNSIVTRKKIILATIYIAVSSVTLICICTVDVRPMHWYGFIYVKVFINKNQNFRLAQSYRTSPQQCVAMIMIRQLV